jgi:CRISPR/Cas system CMR subunit Cmr6 (Cas7 group RAMP superfamily)
LRIASPVPHNERAMPLIPLPIPENTVHHLESLAGDIHRTYFAKYPPLRVRWGQQITRKRRRSIRLGSYNHVTAEIRIHPLLNSPHIPAFVVQSIIHHEYLHHVLGANHNRRFHSRERQYRHFRESQEWIRRNLFLLLGRRRSELQPRSVAPLPVPQPVAQMALF